MKTPEDIRLSDGRVVTVADNASVDSWGVYRKVLVGNPEFPQSFEVARQVKSGDDLSAATHEVAAQEELLAADIEDLEIGQPFGEWPHKVEATFRRIGEPESRRVSLSEACTRSDGTMDNARIEA